MGYFRHSGLLVLRGLYGYLAALRMWRSDGRTRELQGEVWLRVPALTLTLAAVGCAAAGHALEIWVWPVLDGLASGAGIMFVRISLNWPLVLFSVFAAWALRRGFGQLWECHGESWSPVEYFRGAVAPLVTAGLLLILADFLVRVWMRMEANPEYIPGVYDSAISLLKRCTLLALAIASGAYSKSLPGGLIKGVFTYIVIQFALGLIFFVLGMVWYFSVGMWLDLLPWRGTNEVVHGILQGVLQLLIYLGIIGAVWVSCEEQIDERLEKGHANVTTAVFDLSTDNERPVPVPRRS